MRSFQLLRGLSFATLLSSASLAAIACENPLLPTLPPEKGRIHERDKRLIELDTLRYVNEIQGYVACLQKDNAAFAGDGVPSLESALLAGRGNAAVAELAAIKAVYEERIGPLDVQAFEVAAADRRAVALEQWKQGGAPSKQAGKPPSRIDRDDQAQDQEVLLGGVPAFPDGVEQQRMSDCGTSGNCTP